MIRFKSIRFSMIFIRFSRIIVRSFKNQMCPRDLHVCTAGRSSHQRRRAYKSQIRFWKKISNAFLLVAPLDYWNLNIDAIAFSQQQSNLPIIKIGSNNNTTSWLLSASLSWIVLPMHFPKIIFSDLLDFFSSLGCADFRCVCVYVTSDEFWSSCDDVIVLGIWPITGRLTAMEISQNPPVCIVIQHEHKTI